jgi:hypothetical protein
VKRCTAANLGFGDEIVAAHSIEHCVNVEVLELPPILLHAFGTENGLVQESKTIQSIGKADEGNGDETADCQRVTPWRSR